VLEFLVRFDIDRIGGLEVAYLPHLDGGGRDFGRSFVPVAQQLFPDLGRVHEFCAGPGFIGFGLLAQGLCRSLCLSDINPEAIEAVEETIRRNRLHDRVTAYCTDGLSGIPETERWDLVVSNPPHFQDSYPESIRHHDQGWRIHQNFYESVASHMNSGGSVLFQENFEGSRPDDFEGMIADGGLHLADTFVCSDPRERDYIDTYYFLWAKLAPEPFISPLSRDSFVHFNDSPITTNVQAAETGTNRLALSSREIYQLKFSEEFGVIPALLAYRVRWGPLTAFLRSLHVSEDRTTRPIRFCPGNYVLRIEETLREVCRIAVH
jgi:hypothetical protein